MHLLTNPSVIMKKKPLFFIAFLLLAFSFSSIAQSDIVPAGGDIQNANGNVSFTVGQLATENASGGSVSISEGVQQPFEILTVGIDHYPEIALNAIVFPNPTDNIVQLEISGLEIPRDGLQAFLFDSDGKLLQRAVITGDRTTFNIGQYATGNYLLVIRTGKHSLKTFKIIRR